MKTFPAGKRDPLTAGNLRLFLDPLNFEPELNLFNVRFRGECHQPRERQATIGHKRADMVRNFSCRRRDRGLDVTALQ